MGAGIRPRFVRHGRIRVLVSNPCSATAAIACATALALSACSTVSSPPPPTSAPGAGGTSAGAPAGAPGQGATPVKVTDAAAASAARDMALGREARREGRLADASIAFERVIRTDPNAFDARLELVQVLLTQSIDLGRAAKLLDEARALRAYDVQVDRLRAWLDELRGDLGAAADDYARVLAVSPDPELRLRRAALLIRLNRVDEAIGEYERVAAERPADRGTRSTLADIYEYRGRVADAERMLLEIERLGPGELAPLRKLAAFYRRTGQYAKAVDVEGRIRALEHPSRVLRPLLPSVR